MDLKVPLGFSFLASFLDNYFKSFHKIDINSQIYILVYTEMTLLFEVYRKAPERNVSISLLCSLNQTSTSVEYFNENDALVRRKDLTGVHFRVGYLPNLSFFYEENKVSCDMLIFFTSFILRKAANVIPSCYDHIYREKH